MGVKSSWYKIVTFLVVFLICSMTPACAVQYSNMNMNNDQVFVDEIESSSSSSDVAVHGLDFIECGVSPTINDKNPIRVFADDLGVDASCKRHVETIGCNGKPQYIKELTMAIILITTMAMMVYNAYTLSLVKLLPVFPDKGAPVGVPLPENPGAGIPMGNGADGYVPQVPFTQPLAHYPPANPMSFNVNPLGWFWMHTILLQGYFNNHNIFNPVFVQPHPDDMFVGKLSNWDHSPNRIDDTFNQISIEQVRKWFEAYKMDSNWEKMRYKLLLSYMEYLLPFEIATKINGMSPDMAAYILAHLSIERAAEVLMYLDSDQAATILLQLDETTRIKILNELRRIAPEAGYELTNTLTLRGYGIGTSRNNNDMPGPVLERKPQSGVPYSQLGLSGSQRQAVVSGLPGDPGGAAARLKILDPLDVAEILKILILKIGIKNVAEIFRNLPLIMQIRVARHINAYDLEHLIPLIGGDEWIKKINTFSNSPLGLELDLRYINNVYNMCNKHQKHMHEGNDPLSFLIVNGGLKDYMGAQLASLKDDLGHILDLADNDVDLGGLGMVYLGNALRCQREAINNVINAIPRLKSELLNHFLNALDVTDLLSLFWKYETLQLLHTCDLNLERIAGALAELTNEDCVWVINEFQKIMLPSKMGRLLSLLSDAILSQLLQDDMNRFNGGVMDGVVIRFPGGPIQVIYTNQPCNLVGNKYFEGIEEYQHIQGNLLQTRMQIWKFMLKYGYYGLVTEALLNYLNLFDRFFRKLVKNIGIMIAPYVRYLNEDCTRLNGNQARVRNDEQVTNLEAFLPTAKVDDLLDQGERRLLEQRLRQIIQQPGYERIFAGAYGHLYASRNREILRSNLPTIERLSLDQVRALIEHFISNQPPFYEQDPIMAAELIDTVGPRYFDLIEIIKGFDPDTKEDFKLYVLDYIDPQIQQILDPYFGIVRQGHGVVVRQPVVQNTSLLWYLLTILASLFSCCLRH